MLGKIQELHFMDCSQEGILLCKPSKQLFVVEIVYNSWITKTYQSVQLWNCDLWVFVGFTHYSPSLSFWGTKPDTDMDCAAYCMSLIYDTLLKKIFNMSVYLPECLLVYKVYWSITSNAFCFYAKINSLFQPIRIYCIVIIWLFCLFCLLRWLFAIPY